MRAISLVSREFTALAQPYLWNHVNLERVQAPDLHHVLAIVLPKHGHLVKRISIIQFDYLRKVPLPWTSGGNLDSGAAPPFVRQDPALVSVLYSLLAVSIGGMPKLYEVVLPASVFGDVVGAQGSHEWGSSTSSLNPLVAGALTALGTRLKSLKLLGEEWEWVRNHKECTGGRLATFLFNFPSLTHFTLNVHFDEVEHESLISTLSSLRHLKTLELTSTRILDDDLAAAPWVCPLEGLSLGEDFLESCPTLFTFLAKFSATLKSLTVSRIYFPLEEPLHTSPPLLHLRTLDINTHRSSTEQLATFPSCPLTHLIINVEYSSLSTKEWYDFVLSRVGTLKRVRVYVDHATTCFPSKWRPLRDLCTASGIECQVGVKQTFDYGWDEGWDDSATGWLELLEL